MAKKCLSCASTLRAKRVLKPAGQILGFDNFLQLPQDKDGLDGLFSQIELWRLLNHMLVT